MTDTCCFTIINGDGDEAPCDRPATGWRWYQGHEHEDALDVACDEHENEGGRRIASLQRQVNAAKSLSENWPAGEAGPFRYALKMLLQSRWDDLTVSLGAVVCDCQTTAPDPTVGQE